MYVCMCIRCLKKRMNEWNRLVPKKKEIGLDFMGIYILLDLRKSGREMLKAIHVYSRENTKYSLLLCLKFFF